MASDRMSFDEACRDLGITEAELENLVAAGEISSIKEGDTLYFKRDVVRKFKEQREHEPTILLSDDEINLLDDSVEEIDLLSDDEATTPSKAKEAAAAKAASSLDEDLPEIDLSGEETASAPAARRKEEPKVSARKARAPEPEGEETLLNLDSVLEDDSEATTPVPGGGEDATMLDTDLLDLSGEADPFSADTAEETSATDLTEAGTLLRSGGARVMQMKRKKSMALWTSLLAVACVLLVLPLGVLTSLMFGATSEARSVASEKQGHWAIEYSSFVEPVVQSLADFFKPAR